MGEQLTEKRKRGRPRKNEGMLLRAPSVATEASKRKADLSVFTHGKVLKSKNPYGPIIEKSRFYRRLMDRPEDLAIYRAYVEYYNAQNTNYSMDEIADIAAMRMILDKFEAWILECDDPEQAEKMGAEHSMIKGLFNLLQKYRRAADDRKPVTGGANTEEMMKKFKRIEEGDYKVIEDEKVEGGEDEGQADET